MLPSPKIQVDLACVLEPEKLVVFAYLRGASQTNQRNCFLDIAMLSHLTGR